MTYGLPIIIVRPSNNYGPYQYPEKFIPLFVTNALEGKTLPLYGQGTNVRDWLYVDDNCRAIELAALRGAAGEAYNIGAGERGPEHRGRRADLRPAREAARPHQARPRPPRP